MFKLNIKFIIKFIKNCKYLNVIADKIEYTNNYYTELETNNFKFYCK